MGLRLPVALATALSVLGALLVAVASPASAGPPPPTEITVTTTADELTPLDEDTSLREAVTEATLSLLGGATIVLEEGATYDLTICNLADVVEEDLNLTGDLDFLGATQEILGGGPFTIEGNGATINQTCPGDRVVELFGLGDMELHDLTLTGGDHPGNGGAVSRNLAGVGEGSLSIEGSTLAGHSAGLNGGAAYSDGALSCSTSTFTENDAGGSGGAMFAAGSLTVDRCTVDRNRAGADGGGVAGDNLLADVSVSISRSTITANRAEGGGGANVDTDGGLDTDDSVIALSSEPGDGNGDDCVVGGTATSAGENLGGNDCGFGAGDVLGDHPNLMPLADNGGFTETKAPVMDSGVVDLFEGCEGTDQRGEPVPAGDGCDIGAIDEPPPACAVEFPDVPADHPFFAEVCWMAQMGITTGYIDGSFNPAGEITRQSMAAFTFRVSGSPLFPLPAEEAFPDVPTGFVFRPDIEWMADEDITRGYADGTFKPLAPVTRQAMAAFMYRLASEPEFVVPTEATYSDYETDHPFFTEIEWLAQTGITTGYEDGEFKPEQAISRQAMAAFLYRLAQTPEVWG